jgi:hypothetical protein
MPESINDATLIPAILTAAAAIVGIIIQTIIFFIKNRQSTRTNFEGVLKEKLEKVYSPLNVIFMKNENEKFILDSEAMTIIMLYGHLFPFNFFNNILQLYKLEEAIKSTNSNIEKTNEYYNLRLLVQDSFKKEFSILQDTFNTNFNLHRRKYTMRWFEVIRNIIINACVLFTVTFYAIFALSYIFQWVNTLPIKSENIYTKLLVVTYAFIIVITSLSLFSKGILFIAELFSKKLGKIRKSYSINDYVPVTGYYQCQVCGEKKKLYKHGKFATCSNYNTPKKFLKLLYTFHEWKLVNSEVESINNINKQKLPDKIHTHQM